MGRKHLQRRTLYKNHMVYFRFKQVVSMETASLSGARCQSRSCTKFKISAAAQLTPPMPFKESMSRGSVGRGGLGVMGGGVEASHR